MRTLSPLVLACYLGAGFALTAALAFAVATFGAREQTSPTPRLEPREEIDALVMRARRGDYDPKEGRR